MSDLINHPSHYCDGGIETIDYIMTLKAPFHLGNVIKYISRAGKKDKNAVLQDIEKARWYIENYINHIDMSTKAWMIDDGISKDARPMNISADDFIKAKKITDNNLRSALLLIDEALREPKRAKMFMIYLNSARNAINKFIEERKYQ